MFKKVNATVKENVEIARRIYRMSLICPEADLIHFVPGQFANLLIPGHAELLLRRPISIGIVDTKDKMVTLYYQIKGKGTTALSLVKNETDIDAILPVGKGFHLKSTDQRVFLIGGGMGIAPLLTVTQKWDDRKYEAFLGYKGKDYVYCLDEFKPVCDRIFITSDDGTIGEHGLVTEAVKKRLTEIRPDIVLACGPPMMLRAIKDILAPIGMPAQISMEQRMGCGFGACTTCVCGTDKGNGPEYKKVCIEGPVFDLYEVIF